MAIISGPGGIDLEAALADAGVRFVHMPGLDAPDEILAQVLGPDERQVRAVVVAEPPGPGAEHTGMGAWHVNGVSEAHFARSGRGILQVVVASGVATVEVIPGDTMIIQGAEHRYLPIEPQEWVLRHTGPDDAELGARETGRTADPWPSLG